MCVFSKSCISFCTAHIAKIYSAFGAKSVLTISFHSAFKCFLLTSLRCLMYMSNKVHRPSLKCYTGILTSVSPQSSCCLVFVLSAATSVGLVADLVAGGEDRQQVMDEGNLGLSRSSPPITNIQPSKTNFLCRYFSSTKSQRLENWS